MNFKENIRRLIEGRFLCWVITFIVIPSIFTFSISHFSINKISSTGLFPRGTTTPEQIRGAPFLDRVADVWLGGSVVPTGANVCVTNHNQVYVNGLHVVLPYESDPEVGAMDIYVNLSDNSTQKLLYVPANKSACGRFVIKPGTTLASSTLIFRYPSKIPLFVNRTESGSIETVAMVGADPGESTYTMKPLFSDILIITLKVFALWWVLVIAIFESWRIAKNIRHFFSKNKKKDPISE